PACRFPPYKGQFGASAGWRRTRLRTTLRSAHLVTLPDSPWRNPGRRRRAAILLIYSCVVSFVQCVGLKSIAIACHPTQCRDLAFSKDWRAGVIQQLDDDSSSPG